MTVFDFYYKKLEKTYPDGELLSLPQVAKFTGLSRPEIVEQIECIPRTGNEKFRFTKHAVRTYLRAGRTE